MSELAKQQDSGLTTEVLRKDIKELEQAMHQHPDAFKQLEVMHHFTPGIYTRTVLMRAGDLVCGKIHKREHLVIVSAGKARVVSEEFGAKEIVAPCVFKSPPGVKRVLHIEEDMIWSTVHQNSTNTEDLDILEEELIAKDYDEVKS